MTHKVVLGLDVGSSRIKACAYSRSGILVAQVDAPTPLIRTTEGHDFPVLQILDICRNLVRQIQDHNLRIAGVAIATMGEVGTVLHQGSLDDLDFPAWYDQRGADIIRGVDELFDPRETAAATGGHLRTISTVAKLAWLHHNRQPLQGTFANIAGALCWQLTGQLLHEPSLSTTTGVFNPITGGYLKDVWEYAGLGSIALPDVEPAGSYSIVPPNILVNRVLDEGSVVMIAGHDHPVAAIGAGATHSDIVDSIGTGEAILAPWQHPNHGPSTGLLGSLKEANISLETWPEDGSLLLIGEGLRPGLAMANFLNHSGLSREELDVNLDLDKHSALTEEEALSVTEGAFELAPSQDSWARILNYFVDQAEAKQKALRAHTGATGNVILTGGGLRSKTWVRAKVERSSSQVLISPETETVARGCAAMAGANLGWWERPADMPNTTLLEANRWLKDVN